jgi:hypothetical protein
MLGHYASIKQVDVAGLGWQTMELYFERAQHPLPKDAKVGKLVQRFRILVDKLHSVAINQDEFYPFMNRILNVANAAIAPDPFFDLTAPIQRKDLEALKVEVSKRIDDANTNLAALEQDLVRIANKRRTRYFTKMLGYGGAIAANGYLLFLIIKRVWPEDYIWLQATSLVLPGAVLGSLTIGFSSARAMTYEKIDRFDQYDFLPWERYAWVVMLSFVLLTLFWFNLVGFSFGKAVDFKDIKDHPEYGFLIGMFCGLGEAVVVESLMKFLKSQLHSK